MKKRQENTNEIITEERHTHHDFWQRKQRSGSKFGRCYTRTWDLKENAFGLHFCFLCLRLSLSFKNLYHCCFPSRFRPSDDGADRVSRSGNCEIESGRGRDEATQTRESTGNARVNTQRPERQRPQGAVLLAYFEYVLLIATGREQRKSTDPNIHALMILEYRDDNRYSKK